MATWTDIPDEVLEPGKPIRSVDALALRDNAIAIAEGAPNAPRIAGQQGPAVFTNGIANGAVTNPKIASMASSKLTGTIPGSLIPTGAGGVGTYAFVNRRGSYGTTSWGGTISGSNLAPSSVDMSGSYQGEGTALSGTWRIMGRSVSRTTFGSTTSYAATLAVRIA